jgi:hypothetical protein
VNLDPVVTSSLMIYRVMDRENRVARIKAGKCSGLIDLRWSGGSNVG